MFKMTPGNHFMEEEKMSIEFFSPAGINLAPKLVPFSLVALFYQFLTPDSAL